MNKGYILGIDTSNYTTSVAAISLDGELIANIKMPLPVKAGERGLRQSDALFHHTVNLSLVMNEIKGKLSGMSPLCVGVSSKPRNAEGSYMPCFLAGVACAEAISAVSSIPIYKFSHQCGHIMAAIYSSSRYDLLDGDFAAFHISGGTTELVKVSPSDNGFTTQIIGSTKDLNAGQVIDRVGVMMELGFPAGPAIEKLALQNDKKIPKKAISHSNMNVNLSGLENLAKKLYQDTNDKALVSAFVLNYVGRSIMTMTKQYEEEYGKTTFVYAGGVMSNSIIKKMISEKFDAVFAEPRLSSDNAVGIAELARRAYIRE